MAALVEADPDTVGPLVAALVEGTGRAVDASLTEYSTFDLEVAPQLFDLPDVLSRPSRDLAPLADAVREGTAGLEDERWAALRASLALASATSPEDGSLLGGADDESLLALAGASPDAGSAPGSLAGFDDGATAAVRDVLGVLLHTDVTIRVAVEPATEPVALDDFVARPGVAALLDELATTAGGRATTPAATLARLFVPFG